jgi:hypothetical protein
MDSTVQANAVVEGSEADAYESDETDDEIVNVASHPAPAPAPNLHITDAQLVEHAIQELQKIGVTAADAKRSLLAKFEIRHSFGAWINEALTWLACIKEIEDEARDMGAAMAASLQEHEYESQMPQVHTHTLPKEELVTMFKGSHLLQRVGMHVT